MTLSGSCCPMWAQFSEMSEQVTTRPSQSETKQRLPVLRATVESVMRKLQSSSVPSWA